MYLYLLTWTNRYYEHSSVAQFGYFIAGHPSVCSTIFYFMSHSLVVSLKLQFNQFPAMPTISLSRILANTHKNTRTHTHPKTLSKHITLFKVQLKRISRHVVRCHNCHYTERYTPFLNTVRSYFLCCQSAFVWICNAEVKTIHALHSVTRPACSSLIFVVFPFFVLSPVILPTFRRHDTPPFRETVTFYFPQTFAHAHNNIKLLDNTDAIQYAPYAYSCSFIWKKNLIRHQCDNHNTLVVLGRWHTYSQLIVKSFYVWYRAKVSLEANIDIVYAGPTHFAHNANFLALAQQYTWSVCVNDKSALYVASS